jgi:YidC/Oxa1 family membrane protein insertase
MLHAIYSVIPNYGWAIIILTLLVRLVTAPLTVKQMRSMERMRRVQPRMKEIQEKYKDDRQKQSEQMMSLYRQESVNPLGGCLPMVLQLPVFIGLFYALRSSIQLRHAPFFGWIDDLSAPDLLFVLPGLDFPIRVLPVLMGASMFLQQKLTPMQIDPAQARMMLIMMPGMMTVISYTFPSGLVLYWMMSNVLAIAHQLWVGKQMDPTDKS